MFNCLFYYCLTYTMSTYIASLVQFQVVSALQGIAESELDHMTEDITPAISDSRSVPEINGSQGNK